jgi:hypothetical protein
MECFGTTDFDNNNWLITLSAIIISGLHCIWCNEPRWRHLSSTSYEQEVFNLAFKKTAGTWWGTALQDGRLRVRFRMMQLEIFIDIILPALGSTQPLTDISTRNISWGIKVVGALGWQPYHFHVPIVLKPWNLKSLETSGSVQACTGIA